MTAGTIALQLLWLSMINRVIHSTFLHVQNVPLLAFKAKSRSNIKHVAIINHYSRCLPFNSIRLRSSISDVAGHQKSTTITTVNDETATIRTTNDTATNDNPTAIIADRKSKAREKRKKLIGIPKAVDFGQYSVCYQPGGNETNGQNFQALSGLPDMSKPFTVLGIESSCDDTGAAVLCSDGKILGEALASQHEIHEAWGGIVPGLARDAHVEKIDLVVQQALERAGNMTMEDIDAIGVTVGPGLEICLRVGCEKARSLAIQYKKPFVGIHHLEAHILMARLPLENSTDLVQIRSDHQNNIHDSFRTVDFPFLALLVSGGHCQLLECQGIGQFTVLGGTIDDSLGEAFDKVARLLGLPVGGGGGPAVEKLALQGNPTKIELPVPLQRRKTLDFSYAGLKTAVRKAAEKYTNELGLESTTNLPDDIKADIAASFQKVAISHLEQRLKYAMALMEEKGITTFALVGGVAANQELRKRLEVTCASRPQPWKMLVPPPRLCTDQGSMSAWAAIERLLVGSSDDPNTQEVYARYPFAKTDRK